MTDIQLLTMALAVIIPLSLLLYSNSRITDTKETLRAEIQTVRTEIQTVRAEIQTSRQEFRAMIQEALAPITVALVRIENKVDHLAELVASHSERLDKLEGGRSK